MIPRCMGTLPVNKHEGSTLESLFEELGELEEVKARAAGNVLGIQAKRRNNDLDISRAYKSDSDTPES